MTYHWVCNRISTTGVTSGAVTDEVVIRIRKPKKDIQDTGKVKKGQRVKQRSTKYYTQKLMMLTILHLITEHRHCPNILSGNNLYNSRHHEDFVPNLVMVEMFRQCGIIIIIFFCCAFLL
jgi:hypothetical protein